ncbi:MAG: hypothetical protein AAF926_05505, partial [Pseudomonadota bacterium]
YDTFGEAVVIFAAGLGVLLLLGLNGNAGGFRAEVKGQRLRDPHAPTGSTEKAARDSQAKASKSRSRRKKVKDPSSDTPIGEGGA